jgi:hypothetical protein
MAATFIASSLESVASSTVVNRSANIGDGDLVVLAQIAYDDAALTSNATSSGFTAVVNATQPTGNVLKAFLFWKIASSEPSTYTVTNSGSQYQILVTFGVEGHDPAAPFQASSTGNNGSGGTITATGLTVARNDSLGVLIKGGYFGTTNADPAGWDVRLADFDGVNDVFTDALAAGVLGNVTIGQSPTDTWVALLGVVQPPGASPAASPPGESSARRNIRRNAIYRMQPGSSLYTPAQAA